MKVTHRDPGELRTTQSPFCSSQLRDSGGPEGCSAPEVDSRLTLQFPLGDIVTPEAPVLHSQI